MRMRLIQVKLIAEVSTPSQKEQVITKLAEAMVSIEGEKMRPLTWVIIEQVRGGGWRAGGKPVTA